MGDVVTVVKGAAADRSGTIKYIYRQFLFLHARRAASAWIRSISARSRAQRLPADCHS